MSDATALAGGTGALPGREAGGGLAAADRQERLAAWLQFPRRALVLFIAYGLALALIASARALLTATLPVKVFRQELGDWSVSWTTRRPVAEVIRGALVNSLTLVGAALAVALLLALLITLVALLVHRLEQKAGPWGSIVKGLGRLWVLGPAAAPVLGTGALLVFVLSAQLKLLPLGGMARPGDPSYRLPYLVLPALALALLPAALTAQAVARELTLPREKLSRRLWVVGLCRGLGILCGQVGGLLSTLVVVEALFAWPGIGRWVAQSVMNRDYPMLFGALTTFAALVLAGRLLAELFRWLERLLRPPAVVEDGAPTPWRKRARIIWVVLALVLVGLVLALTLGGLLVDPAAAMRTDPRSTRLPPSPAHPLGTDALGQDAMLQLLRAVPATVGLAAMAVGLAFIPSLLGGALAGFLAARRRLWAESLADLLLVPADSLLFFPALPGALFLLHFLEQTAPASLLPVLSAPSILAATIILLPRAVRAGQALWLAAPVRHREWVLGLAGPAALLLGMLFTGIGLFMGIEFLGLGVYPGLGGELGQALTSMRAAAVWLPSVAIVISVCASAFYIAADALTGYFRSKEALARLHE